MDDLKQLAEQHPIWSLEEFAQVTNQWLPRFLPEEKANARVREEVNPRLVRQYTTLGMVDLPLKEGREARYTYRHLLQLLVTRRLLAEGYGSGVIAKLLAGKDEPELETLLEGQAQIMVAPENAALAFLQGLSDRVMPKKAAPPPSRSASQAPRAQAPAPLPPAAPAPAPAAPPPPPALKKMKAEVEEREVFKEARRAEATFDEELEAPPEMFLEGALEAPLYDLCASEPAAAPSTTWTRHEVAPGLELHIRDDFSVPPTDRQAIADAILDVLQADDDRRSL